MSFEYTIYCMYNGGKPFCLNTYNNIDDAKFHLYDMISLEERRHRPYYVHNSFFKNKYPSTITGKFFCIKKEKLVNGKYMTIMKNKVLKIIILFILKILKIFIDIIFFL